MHHDSDSLDSIDTSFPKRRHSINSSLSKLNFRRSQSIKTPEDTVKRWSRAQMKLFINIQTKNSLQTESEIGWISKNNLILTLNNDYYFIKLKHKDLLKVRNNI